MTAEKPTDAAIRERAISLAGEAVQAVNLQLRRLATTEPEDTYWPARFWVDLQFLILMLRRVRRAAELASRVHSDSEIITAAIAAFDNRVPGLRTMRNVGEHIDAYALDDERRHHLEVDRKQLQVGSWDGETFSWLSDKDGQPLSLDVQAAADAAHDLYAALFALKRQR